MVPKRLGFVIALLGMLAIVSFASATQQVVSGKLTITGSGTSWTLTFQNVASSTGSIKCWRYTFPPGVMATGIGTPPTGWQVGGSKPPPAPILGGRSDAGIPASGTAAFRITTDKPFDTSGPPGIAAISEDCVADSPAPAEFGLQPPPPKPKPCRCKRLAAELFGSSSSFLSNETGSFGSLRLQWTMQCTGGSGKCKGTLTASPSRESALSGVTVVVGSNRRVSCTGTCRRRAKDADELIVSLRGKKVRSITIEIDRFCSGEKAPLIFDIVLKAGSGTLDRRRSDLNGNGIADGLTRK